MSKQCHIIYNFENVTFKITLSDKSGDVEKLWVYSRGCTRLSYAQINTSYWFKSNPIFWFIRLIAVPLQTTAYSRRNEGLGVFCERELQHNVL